MRTLIDRLQRQFSTLVQDQENDLRLQEVLIIYHAADTTNQGALTNLCVSLEFAKIAYCLLDIGSNTAWPPLGRFDCVVICTELIWQIDTSKCEALVRHAKAGTGLVAACRCWHQGLAGTFGFEPADPVVRVSRGLRFTCEILPGIDGLGIPNDQWQFDHSRFDVPTDKLRPDCTIIATDADGNPVMWSRSVNQGVSVYCNTQVMASRALRGVLLHAILGAMQNGVATLAGFAMLQIDDFPPSLSDAVSEPVATEFDGLDKSSYYFDVWHRDMIELRRRHELKYSWYVVMNYQDVDNTASVEPGASAATTGQDILAKRFSRIFSINPDDEYGFHGYNHDPITEQYWPNADALRAKLLLARTLWQETVPVPLPTSWVPANNHYNARQLGVLKEVFPEIEIACSLHSVGDYELGELREFGPEPWLPNILNLPRQTYGYVERPYLKLLLLSQVMAMGIWSHFVHCDDVYDIPEPGTNPLHYRNPEANSWRQHSILGGRGLFDGFDDWLTWVRNRFPWLSFVTTSEAAALYRDHFSNDVQIDVSSNDVRVRSDRSILLQIRIRDGAALIPRRGCELVCIHTVWYGTLNIVRCDGKSAHLSIERR